MRDDVAVYDENELRRMEKGLASRSKLVDLLEKKAGRRTYPKRYVFEFSFSVADGAEQQDTQAVVIAREARFFRAERLVQSVVLIGRVAGEENVTQLTLPADASALGVFAYNWSMRDTHTDRLWTNVPMPSAFISNALLGETLFPRKIALPPGTAVEMTVSPIVLASVLQLPAADDPLIADVESYSLIVSLIGDEEAA